MVPLRLMAGGMSLVGGVSADMLLHAVSRQAVAQMMDEKK